MKKLILFSGLYGGSAAILKLINFALFLWLARIFDSNSYAQFGLFYALQTGISTFAVAGIFESIVGLLKKYTEAHQKEKLFSAANFTFLMMVLFVGTISTFYFFFSNGSRFNSSIFWVIASGCVLAFATLQSQTVRLEEKHFASLSYSFIIPLCSTLAAFGALLIDSDVKMFFVGTTLGGVVPMVVLAFLGVKAKLSFNFSVEVKYILKRISPFILVAILGWLSGYGNNYIIDFYLSKEMVARFTFALSIGSVMQMISTALNQVWAPRFYNTTDENNHELVEDQNSKFFKVSAIALGGFGGFFLALYPAIINFLGGNLSNYLSMTFEVFILFASYLSLLVWTYCFNYFLIYDRGNQIMKIVVSTSIVGIITWVLLIWQLGEIGVYVGFFLQMLMRNIVIYIVAKNYWSLKVNWAGFVIGFSLLFLGFLYALYGY
jgi:O-antigen/teichoic acid export membrane protein